MIYPSSAKQLCHHPHLPYPLKQLHKPLRWKRPQHHHPPPPSPSSRPSASSSPASSASTASKAPSAPATVVSTPDTADAMNTLVSPQWKMGMSPALQPSQESEPDSRVSLRDPSPPHRSQLWYLGCTRTDTLSSPSSPPRSPNRPLPEHPTPGRTDDLPPTPLSKYFDPQTALLYADVFERRTSPPTLRDLEVEVEGKVEGEVGLGRRQRQQQQQRGDSDSNDDAGVGVGVGVLAEWFERLVEGVVRYYEGLVWGKKLDRDVVAGMDGAAQYVSRVDVKVESRQGGPPEE
ncbi:hypothetical protein BO99DRAFT_403419 [Aspergillus violaceofuscus CBS 115571]|uniref:Uncharacterized protein n=1 Tax=Aspergillus violaceofuscus (strain CBS 115571) TaxID=1450538 RepID=A0A2V5H3K5_ASPV1|nr:hypothetical protein BO99DRAFT_403419 [Aspergillus violaceofuscus CBS 115571]